MAIEIKRTGCCADCDAYDFALDDYCDDYYGDRSTLIYCKNSDVCDMWIDRIPRPKNGITDAEIDFVKNNPKLSKAFAAGWNACIKEMRKWEDC